MEDLLQEEGEHKFLSRHQSDVLHAADLVVFCSFRKRRMTSSRSCRRYENLFRFIILTFES